ncbi:MAG: FHA domain-containing protein [Gammaproteobacteria bacterium]|nr:FHA domain-containing protein [Gammaproteobacteria bacterium]
MNPTGRSGTALLPQALSFLLALPAAAGAAEDALRLHPRWDLRCEQRELRFSCDYRPLRPTDAVEISAEIEGRPLATPQRQDYPGEEALTVILLLVDSSDPRRQDVVRRNVEQVEAFLARAAPHHRIGLANFDKGIQVLAPPGTPAAEIREAARNLRAGGRVTELYRSVIQGIELLAVQPANRRALFVFSDGLAEDTAYSLEDTVQTARDARVTIIGLGYPRSVAQSVGLQTLRRLAKETGGYFAESDAGYRLPQEIMDAPFAPLDRGGLLQLDLRQEAETPGPEKAELRLLLATPSQTDAFSFSLRLPRPPPPPPQATAEAPAAQPETPPLERRPPAPAAAEPPPAAAWWNNPLLWVGALFALFLAVLIPLRRALLSRPATAPESAAYGYLQRQNGENEIFPISCTPFRIGRGENNDLVLQEESVSRHHVEISYSGAGKFQIADLGSLNGLFINGNQVANAELQPGDRMEIGDIDLQFSLDDPRKLEDNATVFMRTSVPDEIPPAATEATETTEATDATEAPETASPKASEEPPALEDPTERPGEEAGLDLDLSDETTMETALDPPKEPPKN